MLSSMSYIACRSTLSLKEGINILVSGLVEATLVVVEEDASLSESQSGL